MSNVEGPQTDTNHISSSTTKRTGLNKRLPNLVALGVFIILVAIVATVGALASRNAKSVYGELDLPAWAPPSWLFGPMWTVLYLLLAVSGWLYWKAQGHRRGLVLYGVGLVLNAAWTPLFFAGGAYVAALIDIILLDLVILLSIVWFSRVSRPAAWLQVPYILWTLFATALTASIVVLN